MRLLLIGDVHACAAELETLLERLRPGPADRVIFLGDLVDRGPDAPRVFDLARAARGELVLGNHEDKLLRWRDGRPGAHGVAVRLAPHHRRTLEALRPSDWATMESARPWIEVPEGAPGWAGPGPLLVVHAGVRPGLPLEQQDAYDVCRLQCIGPSGRRRKLGTPGAYFWAERCDYPGWVVYGHTIFPEPLRIGRTLGLDTGCCFGGRLSALELPAGRIHQAAAARDYAWELVQQFYPLRAEAVRRRRAGSGPGGRPAAGIGRSFG
ncbi:MAG TPA: metallophosphoesterase [Candidatus Saccharimonadales bacterium]|nr:metallophosphoesterase [Candidatus Saccharimonadales bacterium]